MQGKPHANTDRQGCLPGQVRDSSELAGRDEQSARRRHASWLVTNSSKATRVDYSVIKWLSRPRQHLPRKPQIEDEESRPDQSVEPHRNPKIDGVRRALDLAAAFERHVPLSHAKVGERPRDHDKDKKDYRDPNPRHFFSLTVGRTARRI